MDWYEHLKIGKRVYLVAVHYKDEEGRRIYKRCYLGPVDGYVHAARTLGVKLKPAKTIEEQIENYMEIIKSVTDKLVKAVEVTGSHTALRALAGYLHTKAAELQIKAEVMEIQAKARARAGSRMQQSN